MSVQASPSIAGQYRLRRSHLCGHPIPARFEFWVSTVIHHAWRWLHANRQQSISTSPRPRRQCVLILYWTAQVPTTPSPSSDGNMPSQEPPHAGYGAEVMTSMNAAPTRPHVLIVPQNGSVKEKAACSIEDINVWTLPQFEFAGACSFVVQVPNWTAHWKFCVLCSAVLSWGAHPSIAERAWGTTSTVCFDSTIMQNYSCMLTTCCPSRLRSCQSGQMGAAW